MYRRLPLSICICTGLAASLSACLDRNGGGIDTTVVDLTTGDDDTSTGIVLSTSTTFPEIMTTTFEPVDTDSGTSSGTSSGSTTEEPIPAGCGNGVLDPDEECDNGENNTNEGICTLACKFARCGDGFVRTGIEACDDGSANGTYNACASDCSGPGPRCGDGLIQDDEGELCDKLAPDAGCLKECTFATSCKDIKDSWGDDAPDGVYLLHRMSKYRKVWCAMSTDGGGYTILKHAGTGTEYSAAAAEQVCAGQYGMHLMVPRSQAHLQTLATVAAGEALAPANEDQGGDPGSAAKYLKILGIYPVTEGQSCVGKALNSVACPEWKAADNASYWVTGSALDAGQPGTLNCAGCSLEYIWDEKQAPPILKTYINSWNDGHGAKSTHFLCDIGDKQGP